MHDVFISYESNSKNVADAICSALERNKVRCWYAPRDVDGGRPYASSIIEAIESCRVFVLVLNENASRSNHVLNEVELAHECMKEKGSGEKGIMILPFKISGNVSKEMEYYVKRIHWIDAMTSSLETSIDELLKHVIKVIGNRSEDTEGRKKNDYMDYVDDKETERLQAQIRVLDHLTTDVYEKVLTGRKDVKVLDIGSNIGDQIIGMLGKRPEVSKIVGMDISEEIVKAANDRNGKKATFYNLDCESDDFESQIKEIMKENEIETFDIVNMSQIIHHLKNPFKVMRIVRKLLSKDGEVVVIDIDDGLHMAYPDTDGIFARAIKILSEADTGGYRYNGREMYSILKRAGFKNVVLERNGMNIIGVPSDIKDDLYKTYIELVPMVLRESIKKNPNNVKLSSDLAWIHKVMDEMEQTYMSEEFMMTFGFMVYTAK